MDLKKIFPKVTDDFGNWLAGLVDGEGCFSMSGNSTSYSIIFIIRLRADDISILKDIEKALGIGRVGRVKQFKGKGKERKEIASVAQFWVSKRRELRLLVKFFEKYPLRTKKHVDFNIWKLAVKEYAKKEYNYSIIEYYQKALQAGRIYNCHTVEELGEKLPAHVQLNLIW